MAGRLAIIPSEQSSVKEKTLPSGDVVPSELSIVQVRPSPSGDENTESWQVHFSRFVVLPTPPAATCPTLIPLPNTRRFRSKAGVWLSSRSPTASLQLRHDPSGTVTGSILSVVFQGTVLEEHYVSRLHFSWPQVSCVSGFPARGTRAVFVTYKHSVGETQKFALRFSSVSEVETFINSLKYIFDDPAERGHLTDEFRAEMSSHSAFASTANGSPPRTDLEELSVYSSQLPLSSDYATEQVSSTRETKLIRESRPISPALPPSFTSLLTNCCSQGKQEADNHHLAEEEDLKSQIARYMEDSAFQDLLIKVEKVINEIEEVMSQ